MKTILEAILASDVEDAWACWEGRATELGSSWVSDFAMTVRIAYVDSDDVKRLEETVDPECGEPGKPLRRGDEVQKLLDGMFADYHEGFDAEYVAAFDHGGKQLLTIGLAEVATYYVDRLRLLYETTKFDRLTWLPIRAVDARPLPLRAWRDSNLVGVLMPVSARTVPGEIEREAREAWRDRLSGSGK